MSIEPTQTHCPHCGCEYPEQAPAKRLRLRRLSSTATQRMIALALILAIPLTLWWMLTFTDTLAPVLAMLGPVEDAIDWVRADPSRAWMGLAGLIIPHLGLYFMLFEER